MERIGIIAIPRLGRLVLAGFLAGLTHCPADPYHLLLKQHKIPVDRGGLESFLSSITPSPERQELIAGWMMDLGADQYRKRQDAEERLGAVGLFNMDALRALQDSDDPEIKVRVARILNAHQDVDRHVLLYAVLQVLETNQPPVKLSLLLENLSHADPPWLFQELVDQISKQTVSPEAYERLALRKNEHSRAMYMLLSEDPTTLADGLIHPSPRVNLAAAYQLARRGEELGHEALWAVMGGEDASVRASAGRILAALVDEPAPYYPYAAQEARRVQVAAWKEIVTDRSTWVPPSLNRFPPLYRCAPLLLARGYRGGVIEIDPSGQVIWDFNIRGAWSAERMRNGNTLIASYTERRVVEVTPDGTEIWEFKTPTMNARPLKNGNVLISCYNANKVVEIRKSDDVVVWEYATPGRAHDAVMLDNGNVLLCWEKGVREVNRAGDIAWEWLGGAHRSRIYSVQRLPSGHTLIADYGMDRVMELNAQHDLVWKMDVTRPSDAFRLSNGNTLITSSKEHMEVTPEREIIWRKNGARSGSARR
ncbi:MAG: PQQ-binding-like beta-propeller repeat protein [Verrucomicrobiota bacterium]